jgi:hypothetical protein
MIIIVPYYKRNGRRAYIDSIRVTDWTNNDRASGDYHENEKIKDSIYILKLRILIKTFGDIYTGEIIDNRLRYEQDFERFFEYGLQLVPDGLPAIIIRQRSFNMSITG